MTYSALAFKDNFGVTYNEAFIDFKAAYLNND